jgi:gentisate 1,2-dioxygenase
MALHETPSGPDFERYCAELREAGLDAPWSRPGPLIPPKASEAVSHAWRWSEIEALLRRSSEFMKPGRGAERRILRLVNPGVPERTATHTISVALQYLLPGEIAPAHRHTPNAVRFMLRGEGAYTVVEGEKVAMRPGDLVLTPSMTWHDHGNEGREPVIWIDGLDSPVVRYLEILRMEACPEDRHSGGSGAGRRVHYPWSQVRDELCRLPESAATPLDDLLLPYLDPDSGQPILGTIGCYAQMLRPGVRTRCRRRTSSAVYHVFEGAGRSRVGDDTYEWQSGDFFAVAPGVPHWHENPGREPAYLFSLQDRPLLEAARLYRDEEVAT